MINIQELLLAASKAKENNQLVKGVWFWNGHLMTIAKSVLILVLLFIRERRETS